jgi:hypothetical protein
MDPAMSEPEELARFVERFNQRSASDQGEEIASQMQTGAADLIERVKIDRNLLDALAFADMLVSLEQWFSDRAPIWEVDEQTSGPAGPSGVGVEWTYRGTHDHAGTLNGLPATMREVEVHGYSVFTAVETGDGSKLDVRRYIDWAGLYAQLGLVVNWRVPMPADPEERR